MERIVVVGASLAGLRACESLRTAGYAGTITMIGAEPHQPYDRPPLSKALLKGELEPERIRLRKPAELEGLELDLRLGVSATGLDAARRAVTLETGETVVGDGVIVATGSVPRRLPNQPDLDGVTTLRTLDDSLDLRRRFADRPAVVVIGAGFIGLEVAATAAQRGCRVTVLEGAPAPMMRGLGAEMGDIVARVHARNGVEVRCGVQVEGIEGEHGRVAGVRLATDELVEGEVVVVGIGVAPATDWLLGSGLQLGDGVVCDESLRAAAGIYAAGDCARWVNRLFGESGEEMRVEHWTNAAEQGAAAALNLLAELSGEPTTPYAPVPFFWSDQFDSRIQFVGRAHGDDEVQIVAGDVDGNFVAVYGHSGRLRGRARRQHAEIGHAIPQAVGRTGLMGAGAGSCGEHDATNLSGSNSSYLSLPFPGMTDLETHQLTLPVLAVPAVVLPGTVFTLTLSSDASRAAVQAAAAGDGRLVLHNEAAGDIGVVARVPNAGALPNGEMAAIVQAEVRARIVDWHPSERGSDHADLVLLADGRPTPRVESAARELRVVLEEIAKLRGSRRLPEILRTITEPGELADAVTTWSEAEPAHQAAVLAAVDVGERVDLVMAWAKDHHAELQVTAQIRADVTEGVDKQQREYLLRQQLAAIRKELGEGDDDVVEQYRAKISELDLPEKVSNAVNKEIDRLERVGQQSPEHSWIRTWLDRIFELPWNTRSDDQLDLDAARQVLDADHYGLDEVKDRIVEFLAVRKLKLSRAEGGSSRSGSNGGAEGSASDEAQGGSSQSGSNGGAEGSASDEAHGGSSRSEAEASPDHQKGQSRQSGVVMTLVGPPGVGKTSLGESVARAMGRKFVRVSLGGVRDEAEIRGHRRTYVGSQPGRIARAIIEAGTMNPVVLLDEVDKLSPGGWSGDPTAALLEVLDPAQNHTFRDHYLEVELDLSNVIFIATANVTDTIPGPLLDRMEFIRLDGYTDDEKVFIAERYLLPRQIEQAGLRADEVTVTEAALRAVISGYTREAGVRSLERELGKLTRKIAAKTASGQNATPLVIDAGDVRTWLGRVKVDDEVPERTDVPGVATGLAVTGMGGDVLFIETTAFPLAVDGEPSLTLTGQLGDVMKESAQIALSYVRSHAEQLGVEVTSMNKRVHVHVPAGAVPKDGPSAGITMTTALVSLLTNRPVKPTVGMTGEITLQGKVLPIGGVKQKVLAAHRAGLTEVILPKRNGPDLEDLPDKVRQAMTFHLADTYADVQAAAFAN